MEYSVLLENRAGRERGGMEEEEPGREGGTCARWVTALVRIVREVTELCVWPGEGLSRWRTWYWPSSA